MSNSSAISCSTEVRACLHTCMSAYVRECACSPARGYAGERRSVRTRRIVYAACAISGAHATLISRGKAEWTSLSRETRRASPPSEKASNVIHLSRFNITRSRGFFFPPSGSIRFALTNLLCAGRSS